MVEQNQAGCLIHDFQIVDLIGSERSPGQKVAQIDYSDNKRCCELQPKLLLEEDADHSKNQTSHAEPKWIEHGSLAFIWFIRKNKAIIDVAIALHKFLIVHLVHMDRVETVDEEWQSQQKNCQNDSEYVAV